MADDPDVAALVRELYAAEPGDFVATRKRLAAGLKAVGHREQAASLAKLRKPSVVEDALNRTARTNPDEVAEWATAVEATAAAQSSAIGGGGSADLRAATSDLRSRLTAVVRAAVHHAGAAKSGDLTALLQTLTTPSGVALLRHGVLGSAAPDDDSELFAGAPDPPERPDVTPSSPSSASPRAAEPKRAASAARSTPPRRAASERVAPASAAHPAATPARRGPSAQAVKRHAAAVDKATRARDVIGREVVRLERELATARERLAAAEGALESVLAADPSA